MTDTWDTIADWYTDLVRTGSAMNGFDRDVLLAHLPEDLRGHHVLDVGCGEGIIARALAERGAAVVAIDSSPRMIDHARAAEPGRTGTISYAIDDGCVLSTVGDASVGWVTAGLSLNNVPDLGAALTAIRRVLSAPGTLAFTIPHPCFEAPNATWLRVPGETSRRVAGDYFVEGFWRSDSPEGVRRAGNYHRTLSTYLTALTRHGFALEALSEPVPNEEVTAKQPWRAGLPPFLAVRARRG